MARLNLLMGLDHLNKHAKLKRALETRQLARILGMPAVGEDDELLAGGDIKINQGRGNPWPWLAAIVAMLLAFGVWYLMSRPPPQTETLTPGASKIGISVTPGS